MVNRISIERRKGKLERQKIVLLRRIFIIEWF